MYIFSQLSVGVSHCIHRMSSATCNYCSDAVRVEPTDDPTGSESVAAVLSGESAPPAAIVVCLVVVCCTSAAAAAAASSTACNVNLLEVLLATQDSCSVITSSDSRLPISDSLLSPILPPYSTDISPPPTGCAAASPLASFEVMMTSDVNRLCNSTPAQTSHTRSGCLLTFNNHFCVEHDPHTTSPQFLQ